MHRDPIVREVEINNRVVPAVIALVLAAALGFTVCLTDSQAETSIYIKRDGTIEPRTAPIQQDGDTYLLGANISSSIVLQRDNTVFDGRGYTITGSETGIGFDLSDLKNVTVKNLSITRFSTGIQLSYSADATLANNTVEKCVYGILSSNSPYSVICNNTITDNRWDGVFVTYSDGSIITGNDIRGHDKWGLYLGSSTSLILRDNEMIENRWNFAVSAKFIHDIDASNAADGKPIYYLVNQHDTKIPEDAGYVALVNSSNIIAADLSLTKNGQGVVLVNSRGCFVERSNITQMGYYGIQLVNSKGNTIRGNNIRDNRPPYFGVAIAIQSQSTENLIRNNNIQNNENGILLHDSEANKIYLNNFIGNTVQASSKGSKNTWDAGYSTGGNFWSDYAESDERRGSNQNSLGSDGIGDRPYTIDDRNVDRYPLMSLAPNIDTDDSIGTSKDPTWTTVAILAVSVTAALGFLKLARIRTKRSAKENTSRDAALETPHENQLNQTYSEAESLEKSASPSIDLSISLS